MSLRHAVERPKPTFGQIENDSMVLLAISEYAPFLPAQKDAAILDIGFGGGWFIAACLKLGYSNVSGADFGIGNKAHIGEWANGAVSLHEIKSDIGDFLSQRPEAYEFIHMSHVIEHIPKYSLALGGGCALSRVKERRGAVVADPQHGGANAKLQPLRHACT